MNLLWVLNVVAWVALFIYMLPGAWGASFGRSGRRGDPMRLAVLATALMMAGFSLRWLFAPDNLFLWQLLYTLSIADAVYIAALCRAYGRGPRQ